jgi:rod shape-determining protein MreC
LPEFLWKWRKELVFSLLVAIAFGMLVSQNHPGFLTRSVRYSLALALVPLQKISAGTFQGARDTLTLLGSIGRIRADNVRLLREVQTLKLQSADLAARAQEADQLRAELAFKQRGHWAVISAEVIGRDPASWLERLQVNCGSADGVKAGAGVMTPDGVAGRIMDVGLYSSTVMLLLDPQSSVAGIVERSRVPGTVKGTGNRWLFMQHVSGEDDVKAGDVVITSQISSLFPPGLLLGDVVSAAAAENGLMLAIKVKPRINFATLEHVLILTPKE